MGSRKERVRRPLRQPPNRKVRPKTKWVVIKRKIRFKNKPKKKKIESEKMSKQKSKK